MVATGTLLPQELARRAGRIRLVLTDCDGVLTDGGVYYSARGEELKRFSIRDGMGVRRLREQGIGTAIVTGESSPNVARRSAKLELPHYFPAVEHKMAHLDRIVEETGCSLGEMAFIGDDVNDLDLLRIIGEHGLTGAPGDAMRQILSNVHHVCRTHGGRGAFREFAEWILDWRDAQRRQEP